jgi:hypothetical protein
MVTGNDAEGVTLRVAAWAGVALFAEFGPVVAQLTEGEVEEGRGEQFDAGSSFTGNVVDVLLYVSIIRIVYSKEAEGLNER